MIKVTLSESNRGNTLEAYVKKEAIIAVRQARAVETASILYLSNGTELAIRETVDSILKRIKEE
jgi:nitrogen fixation protein